MHTWWVALFELHYPNFDIMIPWMLIQRTVNQDTHISQKYIWKYVCKYRSFVESLIFWMSQELVTLTPVSLRRIHLNSKFDKKFPRYSLEKTAAITTKYCATAQLSGTFKILLQEWEKIRINISEINLNFRMLATDRIRKSVSLQMDLRC